MHQHTSAVYPPARQQKALLALTDRKKGTPANRQARRSSNKVQLVSIVHIAHDMRLLAAAVLEQS